MTLSYSLMYLLENDHDIDFELNCDIEKKISDDYN